MVKIDSQSARETRYNIISWYCVFYAWSNFWRQLSRVSREAAIRVKWVSVMSARPLASLRPQQAMKYHSETLFQMQILCIKFS